MKTSRFWIPVTPQLSVAGSSREQNKPVHSRQEPHCLSTLSGSNAGQSWTTVSSCRAKRGGECLSTECVTPLWRCISERFEKIKKCVRLVSCASYLRYPWMAVIVLYMRKKVREGGSDGNCTAFDEVQFAKRWHSSSQTKYTSSYKGFLSFVNCCTKSMVHSGLRVIPEDDKPVANDRTYVLSINDSRANTELSVFLYKNISN